jgi:hypothetical protein
MFVLSLFLHKIRNFKLVLNKIPQGASFRNVCFQVVHTHTHTRTHSHTYTHTHTHTHTYYKLVCILIKDFQLDTSDIPSRYYVSWIHRLNVEFTIDNPAFLDRQVCVWLKFKPHKNSVSHLQKSITARHTYYLIYRNHSRQGTRIISIAEISHGKAHVLSHLQKSVTARHTYYLKFKQSLVCGGCCFVWFYEDRNASANTLKLATVKTDGSACGGSRAVPWV